jgi:hypothetical protein
MTLYELVNLIKQISQNHTMINTFGEGDIYDYVDSGGEIKYPVCWLVNEPSTYDINGVINFSVLLIFADLLVEDKSNRLQIQSDQLQVAIDFISELNLNNLINTNISDVVQVDYFQERFDDFTAGVSVRITIRNPYPLNYCDKPQIN